MYKKGFIPICLVLVALLFLLTEWPAGGVYQSQAQVVESNRPTETYLIEKLKNSNAFVVRVTASDLDQSALIILRGLREIDSDYRIVSIVPIQQASAFGGYTSAVVVFVEPW